MTQEVRDYAQKRILESGIVILSGHYPDFESIEHVDKWLEISEGLFQHWENDYIWDMTRVKEEQYAAMLSQLKRNEENVPLELLRTKYRKGYDKLRKGLKEATCLMMNDVVFDGLLISQEDAVKAYAEINQSIEGSGLMAEISRAVFQDKDIDLVIKNITLLRNRVHSVAERRFKDGQ